MATRIEWTNETWNPMRGCSRVSVGCDNCYAMRMARRQDKPGRAYEGLTKYRSVMGRDCDLNPTGIDHTQHQGVDWSGKVRFVEDRLDKPLRWRKPQMVFVNSMGDLFHPKLTDEQIAAVFDVMATCPQHTFQVLTKRAARMVEWFKWAGQCGAGRGLGGSRIAPDGYQDTGGTELTSRPWPLPNVWLGVSAENQATADERIPWLLQVPAAIRFVSCEPLLGAVDLTKGAHLGVPLADGTRWRGSLPILDWVIAGCESGSGARPAETDWFRLLRDQCQGAGVPFFLKQMHANGRLVKMPALDGQTWDQVPEQQPDDAGYLRRVDKSETP